MHKKCIIIKINQTDKYVPITYKVVLLRASPRSERARQVYTPVSCGTASCTSSTRELPSKYMTYFGDECSSIPLTYQETLGGGKA